MGCGEGSALGILTIIGYAVFVTGAALLSENRGNVPMRINNEAGAVHRNFVRQVVVGGFVGLRAETRLQLIPGGFMRTLERLPRRRMNRGAIVLVIGPVLMLLDFLM